MKTLYKTIIIFALFVMPAMAFASAATPLDLDDTIPAETRCDKYYYTKWFDDCPNWRPKGVYDSCLCFKYKFGRIFSGELAKWEYAHNGRMKVKGLAAMVNAYTPPTVDGAPGNLKNPEYMYIYQMTETGRNIQGFDIEVRLQLLDSVRWDTATARVMEFRQGWNDEFIQYCYIYEAYFEQPVWVDSDFYIFGSMNTPNSNGMVSTFYVDIRDEGDYMLDNKNGCDASDYHDILYCPPHALSILECPQCLGEGRPYAFWDMMFSPITNYWMSDWPESPFGYYLVIVDKWDLNAEPNEVGWGEVLGGGRFPDESDDTITAIPSPGFAFVSWNDGSTENPRVIHLTSDTSFVATFQCTQQFNLQVTASDATMGTVTGGGSYYASDVTIVATPALGHRFNYWSAGGSPAITTNPLVVHLVSDTAFVANFEDVSEQTFNLQISSANATMGSVTGGGSYPGGTNQTISAVPSENRFVFTHWSSTAGDSITDNPLSVYLTCDTAFVAHFVELPRYYLVAASNNNAWGIVEGEGMYYEGEQATLTAIPAETYVFEGWSDGEQQSPRIVTVTQDTVFEAIFAVDPTIGIDNIGTMDFTVSPNPTNGLLTLKTNQPDNYELTIYDVNGKTMLNKKTNESIIEIDLSTFPSGQYILILCNKERHGIKTIVKK
ncbi:MAG: T9SS type A sorting domain-containing protein [Bacteroidales bacterium]|nr:T9SS type A sorting domain-containing protein [Bacteroidales bacterium]